jgi:hypothetical protein
LRVSVQRGVDTSFWLPADLIAQFLWSATLAPR